MNKKCYGLFLILIIASALYFYKSSEKSTFQYALMSSDEYAKTTIEFPYQFILSKPDQVLYYFGGNHVHDCKDKQYEKLNLFFSDFLKKTDKKNCVVLVEALQNQEKRQKIKTKKKACLDHAESSYVTFLAERAGISVLCPEPEEKIVVEQLCKIFDEELVAYKNLAEVAVQYNDVKLVAADTVFQNYMAPFVKRDQNLFSIDVSLDAMAKIHEKLFKTQFDPNDRLFFWNALYEDEKSIIFQVAEQASILRDLGIVACIDRLLKQGKNIFIAYGGTHAVIQEPAIRQLFKRE
jgi:hypothetical protein